MRSKQDVIRRALEKLGVPHPASARDAELVSRVYEPVLDDLASRDKYVYGDPDAIDDDASEHVAFLLGFAVQADFGKTIPEQERLMAEARLVELNGYVLSGQALRAEYF